MAEKRGSTRRKSAARKQSAARRQSSARKSSAGGRRQSSARKQSLTKGAKGPKRKTTALNSIFMRDAKIYYKKHSEDYIKFFKRIMEKKEGIANDCINGRVNFINWLADTLRGVGFDVLIKKMPDPKMLPVYGPKGCPDVVTAYNHKPDPNKWTVCLIGNFDQVEPRLKDPFLMLDGRFFPKRHLPENWNIIACWLATFQTFNSGKEWPVNMKVLWTANQADDAPALIKYLKDVKDDFLTDVDFFCNCTTWNNAGLPGGIVYGGRGACHFILEVNDEKGADYSSAETGLYSQTASIMIKMLDDLEKDCIYTYLHLFEAFELPAAFKEEVKQRYVKDLSPEMGYWYSPNILQIKEKRFVDMWKPEVQLESIRGFPKNDNMKTPSKLVARFAVKYMSETAPIRVEEMVNTMLKKKWDQIPTSLTCKLSMDYWSRPWLADGGCQLFPRAKRAASRAFHKIAVEAIDFSPNPLPAVLEMLVARQFICLALASMLDIKKPALKRNFLRNIKMILMFLNLIQKCTTRLQYSKKFKKLKRDTKVVREVLTNMKKIREKTIPTHKIEKKT